MAEPTAEEYEAVHADAQALATRSLAHALYVQTLRPGAACPTREDADWLHRSLEAALTQLLVTGQVTAREAVPA